MWFSLFSPSFPLGLKAGIPTWLCPSSVLVWSLQTPHFPLSFHHWLLFCCTQCPFPLCYGLSHLPQALPWHENPPGHPWAPPASPAEVWRCTARDHSPWAGIPRAALAPVPLLSLVTLSHISVVTILPHTRAGITFPGQGLPPWVNLAARADIVSSNSL